LVQLLKEYEGFASVIWKAVMLVLLMEMYCEVHRWVGLRWHDRHNQVSCRLLQLLKEYQGFASVIWKAVMLLLLMEGDYEVRR
jgi:hypothetical protein